ncbi:MAG: C1 family peptidase [Planctomycetes bacterium]|nr:C1 family peptidase [Planctomycetota bacterium]
MKIHLLAIAALGALLPTPALFAQTVVDLTQYQTDIRSQGNRTTCITFSAVAAIEARYKRQGLTLDLSEEFVNYLAKMFWLHPDWSQLQAGGPDARESQLGAWGGGDGAGMLEWLTRGMRAPRQTYMDYQPNNYPLPYPSSSPHWDSQRNADDWNLDPANLPRTALLAPAYYSGLGYHSIAQPNSPAAIEAVLRQGYEVVWDFSVLGDRSGPIWHTSNAGGGGGHSMLIVGYDRSAANSNDHYFIVKNSWGRTTNPGGYTYIGYDYIQYGYKAAYITGAVTNGQPWPELKLLGRRTICFDGWRGTLDIFHLPGIAQMWLDRSAGGVTDRRVGIFYETNGNVRRVNGELDGTTLRFWYKSQPNENMRWDEQRETPTLGSEFIYSVVDQYGGELAGVSHNNPGSTLNPGFGGYARVPSSITAFDRFLDPVPPSTTNVPEQYLGSWRLQTAGHSIDVRFSHRDDNQLPVVLQPIYAGLVGNVRLSSTTTLPVVARIPRSSPRSFLLSFYHPTYGTVSLSGYMLTWQQGVVAGDADVASSTQEGFYMVREGGFLTGSTTTFGSSCGPANSQPWHTVEGLPELANLLSFSLHGGAANALTIFTMGLSNSRSNGVNLPRSLNAFGMTGCYQYVDPMVSLIAVANSLGGARVQQMFSHPALLGAHVYSQFYEYRPGANQLGLIATNAANVLLGGF